MPCFLRKLIGNICVRLRIKARVWNAAQSYFVMMTSSNGDIFRVTGHLRGEFTGHRWNPRTKASDAELWCFFYLRLNKRLSKQSWGWWFETLSCSLWRHCNVFNGKKAWFSAVKDNLIPILYKLYTALFWQWYNSSFNSDFKYKHLFRDTFHYWRGTLNSTNHNVMVITL